MFTPLKLKRDTPSQFSTLPRTIQLQSKFQQQALTTFPSIKVKNVNVQSRQSVPIPNIRQSPTSQLINTEEFEVKMTQIIKKDERNSERNRDKMQGMHSYNCKPSLARVVTAGPWPMPVVVKKYVEELTDQKTGINIAQGCLNKASVYYFAVERRVFLYDIGLSVRFGKDISEVLMQVLDFSQRVFEMRQVQWQNKNLQAAHNKNIILISKPWQISFGVLQVEDNSVGLAEFRKRWVKFTHTNCNFSLPTQRALKIVDCGKSIFYLDSSGNIHRIYTQMTGWFSRWLTGNKYNLTDRTKPQKMGSQAYATYRKATFTQKMKHYCKVMGTTFKSMFSNPVQICDLVVDKQRGLLFSLVDTNPGSLIEEGALSHTKILSCWDISQEKLQLRCRISEVQLYWKEIQSLTSTNIGKNNKIAQIQIVDRSFFPQSNLLIILQSGVRLYMAVDKAFNLFYHQFPPNLQQKQTLREAVNPSKMVQLIGFNTQGSNSFMTLKVEENYRSFWFWKTNEKRDLQMCVQTTWGKNLSQRDGELYKDQFFFQPSIGCPHSQKQTFLRCLSANHKNQSLHQLARGVFQEPKIYLHATELYIQQSYFLRPIDLLFNAIHAGIEQPPLLLRVLQDYPKVEIQALIVQLLCDGQGFYVRDPNTILIMNNYNKKVLEKAPGTLYEDFVAQFQKYQQSINRKQKQQLAPQRQPLLQNKSSISQQMQQKLIEIFIRISQLPPKQQVSKNRIQSDSKNSRVQPSDAVLIYLARLLRLLWKKEAKLINQKTFQIISILHQIVDFIKKVSASKLSKKPTQISKPYVSRFSLPQARNVAPKKQQQKKQIEQTPFEKLLHFIQKVQQILIFVTKYPFEINSRFDNLLGLNKSYFQSHVFGQITMTQQPIFQMQKYMENVPMLLGKDLEKSVRILIQIKHKTNEQIETILRRHQNLPHYFQAYLKKQLKIKDSELYESNQIQSSAFETHKFRNGDKKSIESLLYQLTAEDSSLPARKIVLSNLKSQMQEYSIKTKKKQDYFLIEAKKTIQKVKTKIVIQQLLLDYSKENKHQMRSSRMADQTYLKNLDCKLLELERHRSYIATIQQPKILITYQLLTKLSAQVILENFDIILKKSSDQLTKSGLSEFLQQTIRLFQGNKKQQKWNPLNKDLAFIIGRVGALLNPTVFVRQLTIAVINNFKNKIGLNFLESLKQDLEKNRNQTNLQTWASKRDIPIIGLILHRQGMSLAQLDEYYNQLFHNMTSYRSLSSQHMTQWLYNWVSYFCLNFQFGKNHYFFIAMSQDMTQMFAQEREIGHVLQDCCRELAAIKNIQFTRRQS